MPNVGLKLTALRSRVTLLTHWASQMPLESDFFKKNFLLTSFSGPIYSEKLNNNSKKCVYTLKCILIGFETCKSLKL